jgi:serine/threonine protein kinase
MQTWPGAFGTLVEVLRGKGSSLTAARFKILEPLGTGGFGAVYEAVDLRSGQHVALKQLDDTSPESIARFKHEFRALADCHHENLVGLKELIEQDGSWLIVMELVPGMDFLRHVQRADNDNTEQVGYDEARLRSALSGVLEGLRALHNFGVLHRDLKPSNIRVRPDGRAVLLDFGLATSIDPKGQSTHGMGVGTVVYMAPEQVSGQSVGPACDLYAVGVCLFEALTGRAPFEGDHAIKIMLDKQQKEAPLASSLVADVPADLAALCARLLAIAPEARPSVDEALAVLNKLDGAASPSSALAVPVQETFAGREFELSQLAHSFKRARSQGLSLMLIEGESGVGKSELISEFLRQTQGEHPELVVLRGRCYENEQVTYKAFDGCIDALSRELRRMPDAQLRTLLPARSALLGQLFPVLRNVRAIAQAPREGFSADPSARRLEAFAALGQLLHRLSEARPFVLVLDDLQWADSESFRMLAALSQERPRIMLACSVRPREELEHDVRVRLEEVRAWSHAEVLPLFGLPREQAKKLARQLLAPGAPEAWLESIAESSQGHPLFISELIQYTQSFDFRSRGQLTLEAALRARIDRLARPERALLEMVALAARPYPLPVFASALSAELEESARNLLKAKLLRQRRGHELGCYHDRIRHAIVALIAKSRLPALHSQLAGALSRVSDADVAEQAQHWDLAGYPERASDAYEVAGNKALEAMAFSRGAQLFERAFALVEEGSGERAQRLTIARADALACSGRSGEAAALYQGAADAAHGDMRIELRSRAAMHMMLAADVGPGFAAARKLLAELGFKIPLGIVAGLLRYAWEALLAAIEGERKEPEASAETAREQVAQRIASELSSVFAIVHPLAFVVLATQRVRRAQRAGSALHRSFALATRGWFRALHGSLEKAVPLLERARAQVAAIDDPRAHAAIAFTTGSTYLAGFDWTSAARELERAHHIAQEKLADSPWLSTHIRYHLGTVWFQIGEHRKLAREVEVWLAEARERNDVFGVALLMGMGYGFCPYLMRGAVDEAVQTLETCIAPMPATPYSFAHLGQYTGVAFSLLYAGGPDALRYLEGQEMLHKSAFLFRSATGRWLRSFFAASALFATYVTADAAQRKALEKRIQRMRGPALSLLRQRSPQIRADAALRLSQIALIDGQRDQALTHARTALSLYQGVGVHGQRVTEYFIGLLSREPNAVVRREAVIAELREAGWSDPARCAAMFIPLVSWLERGDSPDASPGRLPEPTAN